MAKFVPANKKLRVRVKAAAQHSSSELGSAFALHFTCSTCDSGKAQGGRRLPDVVSRRVTNIMRNLYYGEDFV